MNPEYRWTSAELASEFRMSTKTLRKKAKALGIGIDLEGRAGFRYSEADRQRLIDSMKPAAPTARKRRRAA